VKVVYDARSASFAPTFSRPPQFPQPARPGYHITRFRMQCDLQDQVVMFIF
jgi:hypothetical protein